MLVFPLLAPGCFCAVPRRSAAAPAFKSTYWVHFFSTPSLCFIHGKNYMSKSKLKHDLMLKSTHYLLHVIGLLFGLATHKICTQSRHLLPDETNTLTFPLFHLTLRYINIHLLTPTTHSVIWPLTEILHLLQSYLLPLPTLVFHYEFWVLVEHRVLASGQWCEVRKHIPGMDVSWCIAHEPVGLFYHGSHIQVVAVVEKILQGKNTEIFTKTRKVSSLTLGLTRRWGEVSYLKVLFLGAEQQRLTAAGDVGHTGHEQERWMVGKDWVKKSEPLISS